LLSAFLFYLVVLSGCFIAYSAAGNANRWAEKGQTMSFEILDPDKTIDIPAEVAVCPYCKTKITISPDGWVEEEDGFVCDSFTSWCETEPEIDASSDEWDKFLYSHGIMPYVYQLPVDQKIEAWLKSRYRFNLSNSTSMQMGDV
jgi:hypothetical protein